MKYLLDVAPIVVEADSVETALGKLSSGLSVLQRHAGNGVDVAKSGWVTIKAVDEDSEVTDFVTVKADPYPTEAPTEEEPE